MRQSNQPVTMEAESENERLRRFFMQAPVGICILDGPDLVFELINPPFQRLLPKRELLGKPLLEAVPEVKDQQIWYILQDVYTSGKTFEGNELLVPLAKTDDRPAEDPYFNCIYQARLDEKGEIDGISIFVNEVTDSVRTRHNIGERENNLRTLVMEQAPVAIFVLTGRQLIIEAVNDRMLKMLGKNVDIIGKSYAEALPEFEGQPFFKLLNDVFTSGESFTGNEIGAVVEHAGELKQGYYNFNYQPIKDALGVTNSIICTAVDVTEQVNARKKVERAEESLRMAIDAAELGSYYINAADRIFVASPRLKEFFGFGPDEEVPYEAAINQIHPDYRQAAADLVEAAFTKGVRFDMEYPVIGYHDGKIRWVRGIGTVQHDSAGKNSYFTGVLHEITERKQDEIRKNDFIGMVSHELKTPLTSLTGLVQLLHLELKDSQDEFIPNALSRANLLVKKMNNLINGFLNISLFESGKIFINKREFDIGSLIREMIEETGLIATTHRINFSESEPILVHADRDKIGSVISNLLGNAIKYSPAGKVIDVTCRRENDQVIVNVKDQGMGINPKDLEKIFDRFYRVETSNSRHISGFGIGLYLSAEIIKGHGGRIWAVSESGQGSTFSFCLP
jgi:two-component system sensor histidine kinase VicK